MNRSLIAVSLFVGGALSAFGQTLAIAPGGVVNNSSYVVAGLPGAALAPSSIFTLFTAASSTLGPTAFTAYSGLPAPVPTTLGGLTINFTSGGMTLAAPLYYVSATQAAGIVPYNLPPSATATVALSFNGTASAPVPVVIAASSFGIATLNGSGSGPAAIEDFNSNSAIIKASAPAKPGDTGIIYGTGLGSNPAGDQPATTGSLAGSAAGFGVNLESTYNAIVYVGGVAVTPGYAGASQFPGLTQINFTIPTNAPTGCFVPVIVQIGSIVSNSPSIAISSDGTTCSDPMGLTSAQITQAETNGLKVGSLLLTRLALSTPFLGTAETITEDSADAHFYDFTGTGSTSPDFNRSFVSLSSFGSCAITYCTNTYTCVPSAQALTISGLDAGPSLTVSGSGVPSVSIPEASTTGLYSGGLSSQPLALKGFPNDVPYLQPGSSITFTGTGGAGVGAFTSSITMGSPLTWTTNPAIIAGATINRTSPIAFTWTPPNDPKAYVLLSVSSATNVGTSSSTTYNSATVLCLQPASAGSYTLPSWILQALPASSTVNIGLGNTLTGAVLAGVFDITNTTTIPGLDVALANSLVTSGISVAIQ